MSVFLQLFALWVTSNKSKELAFFRLSLQSFDLSWCVGERKWQSSLQLFRCVDMDITFILQKDDKPAVNFKLDPG